MTTLLDPEAIPLTNGDFRTWMDRAGVELQKLGDKRDKIIEDYFVDADDFNRDEKLFNLRFELWGLNIAMKATWSLWRELRAEMN